MEENRVQTQLKNGWELNILVPPRILKQQIKGILHRGLGVLFQAKLAKAEGKNPGVEKFKTKQEKGGQGK